MFSKIDLRSGYNQLWIKEELKLLRQLRGGVNQLLLCLNNIMSIKTFFQSSPSGHQDYTRYEQHK
jgi:hypothetical protein